MSVTLPLPQMSPRPDSAEFRAASPTRRQRVALLREEVSRGTYRVNAEALAVRLLASGDLGLGLPAT